MAQDLRLVLVTPETTLFDEPVSSLRFPLYDGQIGVLPGRAPMVGRLGYGELKLSSASGQKSFYIDGGFVQIKGSVVSILTNRSMPVAEIDGEDAAKQLAAANELRPSSPIDFDKKDRELQRSRQLVALSRKPR